MPRERKPSNAVKKGAAIGTIAGTLLEVTAAVTGFPLPSGSGAFLTGLITAAATYFAKGGRQGEPH
jgi:hypothetical protein